MSTDEQALENQIPILEKWAKRREWNLIKTYAEDASAWRVGHQKELAQLLKDARHKDFDLVLVWSLDRLTREGPAKAFQLLKTLSDCRVKVFSYQETWTEAPNDEMYEMLIAVFTTVAKWESQRRSERTKAGMERVKEFGSKSGRPIGRPRKTIITQQENPKATAQVKALQVKLKNFERQLESMIEKGAREIPGKN